MFDLIMNPLSYYPRIPESGIFPTFCVSSDVCEALASAVGGQVTWVCCIQLVLVLLCMVKRKNTSAW